jgi:nucleoside-diphosphate-sugar epimerase
MKFLVTGATSGLGRNAVEWLLKEGYEVHATGRNAQIGQQLKLLGATFTVLDLVFATDQDFQQLMINCDVIWHCAAISSPWGKYQSFYEANTLVTSKLAIWAGKLGIKRFIHVSTPSIYFDFKSRTNIPESFLAKKFTNNYVKTKYAAEQIIQEYICQYPETKFIILRPRGIFGPYDRVIIPRILAQIKKKKGILHLPSGGQAYIDLTFVLNVVYALFLASTQTSLKSGSTFNITNQQPAKLSNILDNLLKDQLDIQYHIRSVPYPILYSIACVQESIAFLTHIEPQLTRYSVGTLYFDMTLSQDSAKEFLGYKPLYSLEQGIEITANWLRQYGVIKNGYTYNI